MLAGLLHELRPYAYDGLQHPFAPAAARDAELLLAALADQGMSITVDPTTHTPAHTHTR
ncbi:hypothetical protein [Streptomyces sp. NPDC059649]|uniref:hypothetical protein n=1 Tax=Streptomyces sp. NPDC059649 TaxID=3346895 RepID=UPI0036876FBB